MVDLNLCCGDILLDNVINVDMKPPYDVYANVTIEIPFHDNSVRDITCYHGIEHFAYPTGVINFLKEVVRVMDGRGQLTITTPNAHFLIDAMENVDHRSMRDVTALRNLLFGTCTCELQVHRWIYSAGSLRRTLSEFFDEVIITFNEDDHGGPGLQAVCKRPIGKDES